MADRLLAGALLWPLVVPLSTAALCALLWSYPRAQRMVSGLGIALGLAAALLLLDAVLRRDVVAMQFGSWGPPFGVSFVADRFSAAMVVMAALLALAAGLFGLREIRRRHERAGFHPLLHGLLAGINGAFLTGDIFNLYVWFEVTLITALGLIVLGRTRAQIDGALKYAALNLFATLLFLLAIALLYGVTGTLNMADLARVLPHVPASPTLTISTMLFLAGFGIKAGYFPFFFWLTASYHTVPVTLSALFAGLISKAGIYASFRVFTLLFSVEAGGLREIAGLMAAGGMLFGVFGAAVQWDTRRILAFHSVSQFGYIVLGLALAGPLALSGAIFFVLHHSFVKAGLFLTAGAIRHAAGSYDLRRTGGLARRAPLLGALFLSLALSLAGVPPLSGFWAKFMMVDASLRAGAGFLAAVALFVGLMTLYSMTKIWMEAFWKASPLPRAAARPVPAPMLGGIALLAAAALAMGLFPEPFVAYAQAAARGLNEPAAYISTVLRARGVP